MATREERLRMLQGLTRKEMEVVWYFCRGKTDDEILQLLGGLTVKALQARRTEIYKKLKIDVPDQEKQDYLFNHYKDLVFILVPTEDDLKRWRPQTGENQEEDEEKQEETRSPIPWRAYLFLGFVLVAVAGVSYWLGTRSQALAPQTPAISAPSPTSEPSISAPTSPAATQAPADTPLPPTDVPTPTIPVPTNTPIPTPTVNALFFDDFESGLNPAWQVLSGSPSIVNGRLTASEDVWLQISNPSFKNYVITYSFEGKNSCWMGSGYSAIGVRGNSIQDMIAFRWASCENEWDLVSSGEWNTVANTNGDDHTYDLNTFRIEVIDNKFTASVAESFNKSIVLLDQDLPSGNIFVKIVRNGMLDNFRVIGLP